MSAAERPKLFLLDAMALIYRAHFAFIRTPRMTSDGRNTSAIYGFLTSLLEILEKEKPSHIGVAFDSEKPTFRHELYSEYKSNRQEQPEDIRLAKPLIKDILQAWNIPILQKEGFEADDVIATLACRAAEHGFDAFMMTPDKDFGQVVNGHIYLYIPSRMGKPSYVMDGQAVCDRWGIDRPEQVIDMLALMGDSSDNIPGVPGIGEKTAARLIRQFGGVQELLAQLNQLKGKQREKLEENQQQLLLSRRLAVIDTEVDIAFDPDDLRIGSRDDNSLRRKLLDLEFRSLVKRIWGEETSAPAPDLFNQPQEENTSKESAPEEAATPASNYESYQADAVDYRLVERPEDLAQLAATLSGLESFAFDTETDQLDPHKARLVGLSFSWKAKQGVYVPVAQNDTDCERVLEALRAPMQNERITKVAQNAKYDLLILGHAGLTIEGPIFDTMIGHYLLEQDSRHNMEVLARQYLHYEPIPIENLIGPKGKKQGSMADLSPESVYAYACEDADITWRLGNLIQQKLHEEHLLDLYWKVEAPLISVLVSMEVEGVKLDVQALADFSRELGITLGQLEESIYKLAGRRFNLNSPKQLGDILFDELDLKPKPRRTKKTGQYSTNEEILQKLAAEYEIGAKLLDYRGVQKLKSTYVDALPELISPRTGKIHTSFNQAIAATGRLSSNNPNLQNIPIRTERGRRIREAFIPSHQDGCILAADYSQIELRLIAAISQDKAMMEAFQKGEDIHTATAARVFEVDKKEVDKELRRQAKTVNFGIIYGISAFGLSQRLGLSRQRSAEIIEAYFEKYPGIRQYMDDAVRSARDKGYVETLLGRRRKLPDINSANATTRGYAERNAINSPIQGAAADMIKLAMIRIHDALREAGLRSAMVLQVHDELLFDVYPGETEAVRRIAIEHMRDALDVGLPIEVETGSGANWLEAH